MSKRVGSPCGSPRTPGARVASYPSGAIYPARAQECTSRGSAGGSFSLALGIISLAIVLALAMGLRDAVTGTWPKNGLVVITYVPETTLQEARSTPPIEALPETREVDLSVDQVRALLDHNDMADAEPGTGAGPRSAGRARPGAKDAERQYNLALACYAHGDLQGALARIDRAILLRPADAQAYTLRAAIHNQRGEREAALQDLDRALALDPGQAEADALRRSILQAGQP